jgi:hypothetical protein
MTSPTSQLTSKQSSQKFPSSQFLAARAGILYFICIAAFSIYTGLVELSLSVGTIERSTNIDKKRRLGSPRKLSSYPSQPLYYPNFSPRGNDDGWQYYDDDNSYNGDYTEFPTEYSTEVPSWDSTKFATNDNIDYQYQSDEGDEAVPTIDGGYGGTNSRFLMDIRFNKCPPIIDRHETNAWRYTESRDYLNGVHTSIFPLMASDYPIADPKATILKRETLADSVISPGDYQLFGATPDTWMTLVKPPTYPSGDTNAPYWNELRQVIRVQIARRNGDDPFTISRWPDLWSDFDLKDIAKAVDREYPASLQQQLILQVFSQGGLKMDGNMVEFRSMVDFVGTQVRIAALNTWAVEAIAPITFMLKWAVGMPRPEEMAWLIASRQYGVKDGVPEDIIDSLVGMDLTHAGEFTAYMYVQYR